MQRRWMGLVVLSLAVAAVPVAVGAEGGAGVVAVAGSLFPCVTELAERFAAAGATAPQLVVGSSGKLARQIEAGAPFGLFLSADLDWLEYLDARGLLGPVIPIAESPLVLWWLGNTPPDPQLLAGAPRVAVADPEAAPFGKAAVEYLRGRGWYERLHGEHRLIVTGTVLQAALAVKSGGAQLAFTALSVARKLEGACTILPVPPLRHAGASVRGRESAAVEDFWRYLRSPEAQTVWRRWGFSPPGLGSTRGAEP